MSDGSANEDEDGREDWRGSGDDAAHVVLGIYRKVLRVLKFKLYFKNFFPTEDEKENLPYVCWTSAAESIGEIDGGPAAVRRMFHSFGYGDLVRIPAVK